MPAPLVGFGIDVGAGSGLVVFGGLLGYRAIRAD